MLTLNHLLKNALWSLIAGVVYVFLFKFSAQYLTNLLLITSLEAYLVCAAVTTIVMVLVLIARQAQSSPNKPQHNRNTSLPL